MKPPSKLTVMPSGRPNVISLQYLLADSVAVRVAWPEHLGTDDVKPWWKAGLFGFRDHEFFKLKIYALHEVWYGLVG